jgi:hypothetical protein
MATKLTLEDIRNAMLRTGKTEQEVDAELNGLQSRMRDENGAIVPPQILPPQPEIVEQPKKTIIKRKIDAVVPVDPLIEAQFRMKERLSETQRRDIPLPYEYWNEMRKRAMEGEEEND